LTSQKEKQMGDEQTDWGYSSPKVISLFTRAPTNDYFDNQLI